MTCISMPIVERDERARHSYLARFDEELLKGQDNILLVKFDEATLILLRHS